MGGARRWGGPISGGWRQAEGGSRAGGSGEPCAPARDPLRSLVYTAADRAIRAVYVKGAKVVEHGRVLTMDHAAALATVAEGQPRMLREAPSRDSAGRRAEEIAPVSLPPWR